MQKKLLSQTDLKLFKNCQRCFYLSYKYGISRPNTKSKNVEELPLEDEEVKAIKKIISKGIPLPSQTCSYCIYRQLVRETGVENELTA